MDLQHINVDVSPNFGQRVHPSDEGKKEP